MVISDDIQSYQLEINNKSKNDIEIDWNKTSFIRNGHTDGNVMCSGVPYADRYSPRNPTIVMAGTNQSIDIYPNRLVYFSGQWHHLNIPDGENGVYLIFKIGSKEYREKLLISRKTTYLNQVK